MNLIIRFMKSFLSLYALMHLTQLETSNPLTLILFIAVFYIYTKFSESSFECKVESHDHLLAGILSFVFTLLTIASTYRTLTVDITSFTAATALLVICGLGLFIIIESSLVWIFTITSNTEFNTTLYPATWLPYLTFFLCIIVWGFYFLCSYPGIMTPESLLQYAQVLGEQTLSNDPSIIHTLLISGFYQLGVSITGNTTIGLACYTIFQILFLSFVASYVIRSLQIAGIRTSICCAVIAFYTLLPYHSICAVTISKDTLFAANLILFLATLLRFLVRNTRYNTKTSEYFTLFLPYLISGFMICLLDNKGWYVFLITLPFLLITFRESLKIMIPLQLIVLLLVLFVKYPCMYIYELEQPQSQNVIADILQNEAYSHPNDYLDAYVQETSKLWYPDANAADSVIYATHTNEYHVISHPIIEHPLITDILNTICSLQDIIPLYGLLWSIGALVWMIFTMSFITIRNTKLENLILTIPVLILWGALCITGINTWAFHEAYSFVYGLPIFLLMPFIKSET